MRNDCCAHCRMETSVIALISGRGSLSMFWTCCRCYNLHDNPVDFQTLG